MSQALISASVAGRPRWYPVELSRDAQLAQVQTTPRLMPPTMASQKGLDVNIVHRPVARYFPTLDRIVVIDGMYPANCDQVLSARLHVAGLIGASALEDCFLSFPVPGEPEARVTLGQGRLLELSLLPGLPTVGADFDLRHPSSPAPGQSTDLHKARPNLLSA